MRGQLLGAERVEDDDVVEPVEELRLEARRAPTSITASRLAPRRRASGRRGTASRGCEVRIRIALRKSTVRPWPSVSRPSSSTCSRMSKTSGCAFSTSSSSTTRVRTAPHRLGELAALLVADVAGRGADEPGDRVLLAVLAHVDADHRPLVVEQEVGQRLGQLGLADAGRAEEQERAGRPVGVGDAGPGAAHGVGDRARRPRSGRSAASPSSSSMRSSFCGLALEQPAGRDAGPGRDDVGDVVGADLLLDHRRPRPAVGCASAASAAASSLLEPGISAVEELGGARRGRRRAAARSAWPRSVVELLLELADPVEAGLLLLPAGGRARRAAPRGRRGRRAAAPAARADAASVSLASASSSIFSRSTGAPQLVDLDRARSRSPSAAGTRPRRPGRSPCRAASGR